MPSLPPSLSLSPLTSPFMSWFTAFSGRSRAAGRRAGLLCAGVGAAVLASACHTAESTGTIIPTATVMEIVAGTDSQSAPVGTTLAKPIGVKVFDQNGNPMVNSPVSWAVLTGGGSLSLTLSGTDATGETTTIWTLGKRVGVQMVTATMISGAIDTLVAFGTAGPAAAFALLDGDNQTLAAGATSAALRVRAFDQYGNAVPSATVTWSTTAGTLSALQSTTDVSGVASVTLQVAVGSQTVTARLSNGASLTFNLRGTQP